MTISTTIRKAGPYLTNGSTTVFNFSFKLFLTSEIQVIKADTATGAETALTLGVDYTASLNSNQDASPGGSITISPAIQSGYTITILSNVSMTQSVAIANQGGFYPDVINAALDRLTIFVQQLAEKVGRTIRIPTSDSTGTSSQTPAASIRAGALLGFDANGNVTTYSPQTTVLTGSSIHGQTNKTTPVDADEIGLWDSVSQTLNRLTWVNLKGALLTYFANYFGRPADNPFVNGAMLVDQVNNGTLTTVNGATNFYPLDTVIGFGTTAAGVFTVQRLNDGTGPAGFPYFMRIKTITADAAPAAGSAYVVDIRAEGFDWSRFSFGTSGAKTITLPYMARSSLTGTFSGTLSNGSSNRTYPFQYTISNANTWTPITITIVGDTTGTWDSSNGVGAILRFDVGSGSTYQGAAGAWAAATYLAATGSTKLISTLNATLDITGIDVVEGTVSRPYPHQDYQQVLERCKRYVKKIGDNKSYTAVTSSPYFLTSLTLQMRAAPTLDITRLGTYYNTAGTGAPGSNQFTVYDTITGNIVTWATPPTTIATVGNETTEDNVRFFTTGTTPSASTLGQPYTIRFGAGSFIILSSRL